MPRPLLTVIRRASRMTSKEDTSVYSRMVSFNNSRGQSIEISAFYQDTLPSGSQIGTVVSLHGAPGSHKDFKYIRPFLEKSGIRHVGVNYPSFGLTPGHDHLLFDNVERHSFVSSLMDSLQLDGKVVMMGHSRGTENALMLAAERKTHGLVLLNPTGLRMHRGIKPFWAIQALTKAYDVPGARPILNPLFKKLYDYLNLKAASGEVAASCMKTMKTVALGKQKPFVNEVVGNKTKLLLCTGTKDWLIEKEISTEFASSFNVPALPCMSLSEDENRIVTSQVAATMKHRGASVCFEADGHFLQKTRAELVATGIHAMLTADTQATSKL